MSQTGFNYLDELSPEERSTVIKQTREYWNSLTVEQRTAHLATYYEAIRNKIKEKSGLITQEEAIKEIINVDIPLAKEEAIEELTRNGRLDVAHDLRRRRLGIDTLEIFLFDQDTGEPIP
jgi:hypothetical protein